MGFVVRLLLLVAIAVSPLIAVHAYTYLELRAEREAEIHQSARAYASAVAGELGQAIRGVEQLLAAVSLAPPVRQRASAACAAYLSDVKARLQPQLAIAVVNERGDVVCRSGSGLPGKVNDADREHFKQAVTHHKPALGEYSASGLAGQHAIHVAYPVSSEAGRPLGAVVAPLDLDWLADRLARHQLPPSSSLTVADRNGTILVRLPERERVGEKLPAHWLPTLEAKQGSSIDSDATLDAVRRVIAYVPLEQPPRGLFVTVGLAHDVAMADIRRTIERSAYLVVFGLLLALLVAWFAGHYTLDRPLRRLHEAVRRLGAGDLTARTHLQGRSELDALGRALDGLAQMLERRETERGRVEEDLRRSRDEALQASTAKSKFLAAASHDLRQPLQSMSMTVALLEMRHRNDADTPVIARLNRAVTNLAELLNALLDISHLEAGLVAPNFKCFGIASLLADVAHEFSEAARAKGVDFKVHACDLSVRSDPSLLARMVRNLMENAVKFTPQGGAVDVFCKDAGRHVAIVVQDTGIGIPEEKRAEIFREFRQLNDPERDRSKALGLGLPLVDRVSRLLEHPVSVESKPGRGSVFTITVPKAAGNVVPTDDEGQAPQFEGHVLLVEDDELVLAATAQLLEELGARVTTARSAEDALSVLEHSAYDLIIADYRLPASSGLEVIRHARERKPRILAAVLTGDPSVENLRRSVGLDTEIIQKPVRLDRLSRLFARLRAA